MNYSPKKAGLFQAVGLAAYVLLFASVIQTLATYKIEPNFPPFIAVTLFLLTFIISASVCASIALIYPFKLFFEHKQKQALTVILWTVGWLILFLVVFLVSNLIFY